jgi:hypothetical protein
MLARSCAGRASQVRWPSTSVANVRSALDHSASTAEPILRRRSAGSSTSRAPCDSDELTSTGIAVHCRSALCAMVSSSAAIAGWSASDTPAELWRSGAKMSAGNGILVAGAKSHERARASGSATRSSIATCGSPIRLTNDVLAPFSRRRRTRYGNRSR